MGIFFFKFPYILVNLTFDFEIKLYVLGALKKIQKVPSIWIPKLFKIGAIKLMILKNPLKNSWIQVLILITTKM